MAFKVETRQTGGRKLKAVVNKARRARGYKKVRVGFFKTARYMDGTPVTNVAAWNEFGTRRRGRQHSPSRPFMRRATRGIRNEVRDYLKAAVDPRTLVVDQKVADNVGAMVQGAMQKEIVRLRTPPNAPATVEMKGSSNPLIDTGKMLRSVSWRAEK